MGLFSSDAPTHFPLAKGKRLDGTEVRFPQDLPADATLVVLMFEDALDPLADQWARLGDRIAEAHGGRFTVVEAPIVGKSMKLLGDLGTVGIRSQIQTEAEHDRTVPLFVDRAVFRKALKLDKRDVTAVLLARDGRIAWRGEGDIDFEEIETLEAAVAELLAAPVPDATDHPDLDADGEKLAPEPEPEEGAEAGEDDGPQTADDGASDADREA